jgi:hypothetical protein
MDPERSSLLVTKLLADIVPGDLAVIRLLDVSADQDVLPSRRTGKTMPCSEDPAKTCNQVVATSDWEAAARSQKLGALVRLARGDAEYKRQLERHLEQRANNSLFHLALRAGQGIFDEHQRTGRHSREVPRTVIWLSDGTSDSPDAVRQVLRELVADGTDVVPVVFGAGTTELARSAGLTAHQASNPAGIMKAFAGAFRRIVQAPYEIDNLVSSQPSFELKPNVEEAWIVTYGDDSLGDVRMEGPQGSAVADFAADRWAGAGAYKVAYLKRPAAGRWTLHVTGGGPGVAYAVVQRSELTPVLLEPQRAASGTPVLLVAGVQAGAHGGLITDPEALRGLTVTAELEGKTVSLVDDGTQGDAVPRDGRFTARVTFHGMGKVPVRIHIRSPLVNRVASATVEVYGMFRNTGGPVDVDFGALSVNSESCRPLVLHSEHSGGALPFELRALREIPPDHRLELRMAAGALSPNGGALPLDPGDRLQICLRTLARAPSSSALGEPWLELRVAGAAAADQRITLRLRWQVHGLSFWQRWAWLILLILALLVLCFVIGGYVVPQRFQGALAVTYVPEREDLDEQTPQPVKQWRGVGIGFYRNARAYLQPDFRLSGHPQGALASLHAEKGGTSVQPGRGLALFRETLDGEWETLPAQGRRARAGDVYRIGDHGPFFRIATRGRG